MNQLEAAFFYGDFRQLNEEVAKFDVENRQAIVYNIVFVDEENEIESVVKILT